MRGRKTFKRCQYEYNAQEMEHFRLVDEYCNWASYIKIAFLFPLVVMIMFEEQVFRKRFTHFKLKMPKNLFYMLQIFEKRKCSILRCQEMKEKKIINMLYYYGIFLFVLWKFVSALYMAYFWRLVSRYRGVDERKMYVVSIIIVQLLSIASLSVAVYQYFALPSEKYIKMNAAFFYCIGYEVLAIIATVIYLKFLINYW
ncbi:hypothetical protein GCK72_007192 [Caenorhabditis remanei]|uniref:Uncharacterized protein n=1 Tax=Caenorhabditis remanei TaxID=31234 RepID=A0A6A5HLH8_CAERE|nr:hypothetical protein GCK72_007192 [Caenorhabditis remanei]KAF1767233.1 hypothetical protein GCK72_007192 [Caenorhabditis remanei]